MGLLDEQREREHREPPAPAIRLGVIHLLGWMASVGAALAILRLASDDSKLPEDHRLSSQLTQLLIGTAYGTALGGLGLLVYRRLWHGARFPSQPGHWLFLLGTVGLLIDGGSMLAAQFVARYWRLSSGIPFPEYWLYQTLGWSLGVVIGIVALWFVIWSQPPRWSLLAVCVWFTVLTNAVTHSLPLARELSGVSIPWLFGIWPYYYALLFRIGGDGLCVAMLLVAVVIELRARVSRDWLHWAGVFAGATLPIVDALNRAWELLATKW